jgi:hypothetical protein
LHVSLFCVRDPRTFVTYALADLHSPRFSFRAIPLSAEFISNSKSGQFFFFSHNSKYMIKTISHDEMRFLKHFLPDYYYHLMAHPNTLLTRFFGMHKVNTLTRTFAHLAHATAACEGVERACVAHEPTRRFREGVSVADSLFHAR